MAKNRPLNPLYLNLLVLTLAVAVVSAVHLTLGRGLWLQATMAVFSLPWAAQFFLLAAAANGRRAPPPYVSKFTFATWAGVGYPLIGLSAPTGTFPAWFLVISAPVGFLMCYLMITVFSWMVTLIPRWRFPWTRNF